MFVYFIRSGNEKDSPIKIGVAKNVEHRMQTLQIGNPVELNVLAKIKLINEKHAYWIEKNLHKFFKSDHIRGEWFNGNINMKKAEKICESKPMHFPKNKKGKSGSYT